MVYPPGCFKFLFMGVASMVPVLGVLASSCFEGGDISYVVENTYILFPTYQRKKKENTYIHNRPEFKTHGCCRVEYLCEHAQFDWIECVYATFSVFELMPKYHSFSLKISFSREEMNSPLLCMVNHILNFF